MTWSNLAKLFAQHWTLLPALAVAGIAAGLWASGVVEAEGGVTGIAGAALAFWVGIASERRAEAKEGREESAEARAVRESHFQLRELRYSRLKALDEFEAAPRDGDRRNRLLEAADDDVTWLDGRIDLETVEEGFEARKLITIRPQPGQTRVSGPAGAVDSCRERKASVPHQNVLPDSSQRSFASSSTAWNQAARRPGSWTPMAG